MRFNKEEAWNKVATLCGLKAELDQLRLKTFVRNIQRLVFIIHLKWR